jgi:hypothetical protein
MPRLCDGNRTPIDRLGQAHQDLGTDNRRMMVMLDLLMLALILGSFALLGLYVRGCERA